jgi:hypothetical protein
MNSYLMQRLRSNFHPGWNNGIIVLLRRIYRDLAKGSTAYHNCRNTAHITGVVITTHGAESPMLSSVTG